MSSRKLAVVTGASSGIGLELAKCAAQDGYDLIVAADTPFVESGPALKDFGVDVRQCETDLSTKQGVEQLLAIVGDRPVDVLVANAGHGLGHGFLESGARRVDARAEHQHHRDALVASADREKDGRTR
jgi:short-subunit dehydrogenase